MQDSTKYSIKRSEVQAEFARRSFWRFCLLMSPDFYKPERIYLKNVCDTLQDLFEGKLVHDGRIIRNLLMEIPPRHGKSRTLTNFAAWVLGRDNTQKIITASFNDDLAQDFSRFTRDIIAEEKNMPDQLVYSDIFDTRIKQGDAAYHKWATEGQFFNYKGTGIGGSITGRGGSILIVDDPVKDAETAYNEAALDKIWLWYSGTFLSRAEENAIQIICMTPWAKQDLGARAVDAEPKNWHKISMPARVGDGMLCDELLSRERYDRLKNIGDENIIAANYDMVRLDVKGQLYKGFKTYDALPEHTDGNVGYTDTADEGNDYLCSIQAKKKGPYFYVTDVVFTQEPQEITEKQVVDSIIKTETRTQVVESNNGGRAFARNVKRILEERKNPCAVNWFHQSANKKARILTNAPLCMEYVIFPEGWGHRWNAFYLALMGYQKEGKNKHDDAPDALTGLVEKHSQRGTLSVGALKASDLGL